MLSVIQHYPTPSILMGLFSRLAIPISQTQHKPALTVHAMTACQEPATSTNSQQLFHASLTLNSLVVYVPMYALLDVDHHFLDPKQRRGLADSTRRTVAYFRRNNWPHGSGYHAYHQLTKQSECVGRGQLFHPAATWRPGQARSLSHSLASDGPHLVFCLFIVIWAHHYLVSPSPCQCRSHLALLTPISSSCDNGKSQRYSSASVLQNYTSALR